MRLGLIAILLAALAGPVAAQNAKGLMGRDVVFTVTTYDDPAAPLLTSQAYIARVAAGPEFGMVREGLSGLDVVPVLIDISADQIILDYSFTEGGAFFDAKFNGYVLEFLSECVLISDARIDRQATTLPLKNTNLVINPHSLGVNVAGMKYTPSDRIVVQVDVADCPLG